MAKIGFSRESLEGPPPVPDGQYEVRLTGFKLKMAKSGTSINLNPQLEIVNHPQFNGRPVFDNLNSGASWIVMSFCHAFGFPLDPSPNGGGDIPGDFIGLENVQSNPDGVQYQGPLTGSVAKVYLKQVEYQGKTNSKVDQWFCALQNCNEKHATGLAK